MINICKRFKYTRIELIVTFSLHPTFVQRTPTGELKRQQQQQQQQLEGVATAAIGDDGDDPVTALRRGSNELSELELEKQRALLLAQLKEPESDWLLCKNTQPEINFIAEFLRCCLFYLSGCTFFFGLKIDDNQN